MNITQKGTPGKGPFSQSKATERDIVNTALQFLGAMVVHKVAFNGNMLDSVPLTAAAINAFQPSGYAPVYFGLFNMAVLKFVLGASTEEAILLPLVPYGITTLFVKYT